MIFWDDIPTPREVESDDAEEIEVGAIAKAAGAEVQLCEELKAFTSDLSDITEGKPLFGEELEVLETNFNLVFSLSWTWDVDSGLS